MAVDFMLLGISWGGGGGGGELGQLGQFGGVELFGRGSFPCAPQMKPCILCKISLID